MSNHYNESIIEIISRRRFLQQAGLLSGSLGLGILGGLGSPQTVLAVCEPPGSPGTPQKWRHDCRPIRVRRPASTLSNEEIQKLRNAYQAMRALDTSDPNDPRAFHHQANIHCWYCGHGTQVHFTWQFFAWHRAYLYFHERILGKLIGDMDFRLPYWDWDAPAHRKIPGAYTSPNDATNPLWNGTRAMTPSDEIPDEDVGEAVMDAALTAGSFAEFGGTASGSGIPEGAPHGSVHVDVGGFSGDMGSFDTAARDPIFYAHHSNVDKMWSDWNKASSTHTNPTDSSFLNLTWNFYDENKVWRSITAAQILNHENQLRYVYGPSEFTSKFLEILPCLLDWIVIRTDWSFNRRWKLPEEIQKRLIQMLEKGGRVRLHIRNLSVPTDKSAVYRIYANPEAAKADEGPGSNGYLGAFPVVLNSQREKHNENSTRDVTINLSKQMLESFVRSPSRIELTYVERGAKGAPLRPTAVRAKELYFSTAAIATEM